MTECEFRCNSSDVNTFTPQFILVPLCIDLLFLAFFV